MAQTPLACAVARLALRLASSASSAIVIINSLFLAQTIITAYQSPIVTNKSLPRPAFHVPSIDSLTLLVAEDDAEARLGVDQR